VSLLPAIRGAYAKASMALRLPMSGGFESFSNVKDIPFIARHATRTREEVCKILKLATDKPLVLMSFGGYGIPSLDVSLQTEPHYHQTHSTDIDFSTAAFFAQKFARILLGLTRPADVDILKVEIPEGATPQTPWRVTRLSRTRYFLPKKPVRENLGDKGRIGYTRRLEPDIVEPDSDVRALADGVVSVTPLSLDMTSRVDLKALASLLQRNGLE